MESKLTKIGSSFWLLVPAEFIKVYELTKYLYQPEVSSDGKSITFKRTKRDENYNEPTTPISSENSQKKIEVKGG